MCGGDICVGHKPAMKGMADYRDSDAPELGIYTGAPVARAAKANYGLVQNLGARSYSNSYNGVKK